MPLREISSLPNQGIHLDRSLVKRVILNPGHEDRQIVILMSTGVRIIIDGHHCSLHVLKDAGLPISDEDLFRWDNHRDRFSGVD